MSFMPPVNAIRYLLKHAVDIDRIIDTEQHSEVSHDLIGDILEGAAVFSRDVLAPLNRDGDENPATINDGNVTASPGFAEAYTSWVEGGWQTLPVEQEFGGMGLPQAVHAAAAEMFYASNMAFGLCPMLTSSAVKAIAAHASDELKSTYVEKMVTGEWSGAMNLTEPQAGSDLGPVRTKAVPNADGTYAVSGQKIFITWGDHNCAENIIHLVLARLPDAPSGSKGISLFLCPKYLVNSDGSLGERNTFRPISLEQKLGIHGSPTCVMEFEGATGWLVGEENRGLACMFTMMNEARLFVGVQGVGIGERAYQQALEFAKDRVQGRVIDQEAGAPIIGHPDVRRMLLDMKTRLMGARAISLATAAAGDLGQCHKDEDVRAAAHAREALLTPIAKSYGSDMGVYVASQGIQIHGGMGFIEETGAAQHYRDSRIAPIYEGTNGIQAMDLIGRKLRRDGGDAMRDLIKDLEGIALTCKGQSDAVYDGLEHALSRGIVTLKTATDIVLNADEKHALSVATPYLNIAAEVLSGALLIKAAYTGAQADDPYAESMLGLARFHATNLLPGAEALLEAVRQGSAPIFDYELDRLADL